MQKCEKHNIELECMGGCSVHPSNWYCPECDKEKESKNEYKPDYDARDETIRALLHTIQRSNLIARKLYDKTRCNQEMWDTDGICHLIDKLNPDT